MSPPSKPARPGLTRFRVLAERRAGPDPWRDRVVRIGGDDNPRGEFVLYWCRTARRMRANLALDFAIDQANRLRLPVVVYESVDMEGPGANDRNHTFVLEGVVPNAHDAAERGLRYHFHLPREPKGAGDALRRIAGRARTVVTDDFPTSTMRGQVAQFAAETPAALWTVDGNGIFPMRSFGREMYAAKFFRDRASRIADECWSRLPELAPTVPFWRGDLETSSYDGTAPQQAAASCAIDHAVPPVSRRGGREQALAQLRLFVDERLDGYADRRNREAAASSELSPYLHFGFVSIHEVALAAYAGGAPAADVDAFLEQAIIRRELSSNLCHYRADHDTLAVLPEWARRALDARRSDRRKPQYDAEALESASTEDPVWNLAQRQLLVEGTIHNYLRMLWGKKIIEWSQTPEEAHALMLRLHARYAVDGRDPNTHAGILWCFGKHDRPWAPQRPIFGSIRTMSSLATRRKVDLAACAARVDAAARNLRTCATATIAT
jgi:deoxyribodipyrimidine photo-lyase